MDTARKGDYEKTAASVLGLLSHCLAVESLTAASRERSSSL